MAFDDQTKLATFADKFERGLALLEAGLPRLTLNYPS